MAKKRITLPPDFTSLIEKGDLDALKAVFNKCEPSAYEKNFMKKPALSFYNIPLDFIRWMVAQGADLEAKDFYQHTPLSQHSGVSDTERVALLLELGADPNTTDCNQNTPLHHAKKRPTVEVLLSYGADPKAKNNRGRAPLEMQLEECRNADIASLAETAQCFLKAGCKPTKFAKEQVVRIGEDFEFHRANFNPNYLAETEAGLQKLYELFAVAPVKKRTMHNGTEKIEVTGADMWEQFDNLWASLIPSEGKAATVQGEVVRIAGKLRDELMRNAGGNWGREHRKMLTAIGKFFQLGKPLSAEQMEQVAHIQKEFLNDDGTLSEQLLALSVHWVAQNPNPIPLQNADYDI